MSHSDTDSRLQLLFEAAADMVLEVDAQGQVHWVNSAVETLLGYPRADIMDGRSHWDLFHPDDLPTVLDLTAKVYGGRSFSHLVYRMRNAAGEYLTFEASAKPFVTSSAETRLCVVARDVSTRTETPNAGDTLSEIFVRAQRADSLEILAGGIAHDFSNLLQGVLANAEIARMPADVPDAIDARLADIATAALRASELCRQMLAYTGRGHRTIEAIELKALIDDLVPLLRASVSKKTIIDVRMDEQPAWVRGDATQLRQVVMNLVINASEAIGDRTGHVVLRTLVEASGKQPAVLLYIEDDGCGMNAETRARLFDPFYTTKVGGRGLGMAAVRSVVADHAGSIEVESAPGSGTRFRVRLPLEARARKDDIRKTGSQPPLGGGQALFVDDEDTVRRVGCRILQNAGYRVTLAQDGVEAVEQVRAQPAGFDLVVLDVTMPVMDGREALKAIRGLAPALPVMLSSGYTHDELGPLIDEDPNTAFIAKPYAPKHLIEELSRLLGG